MVAIVAVSFVGTLFLSATHQICEAAQNSQAKECAQYHLGPYVLAWIVRVGDAHNGLITAIATAVIAIFTLALVRANNATGALAEKQFELESRQAELAEKQLVIQGMQTDTLNRQAEISGEQFFAQHRPKLVVKDVYFSSASVFDEVTIEMVNAGQSLAMISGGFVGLDFISDPRDFKEANGRELGPLGDSGFKAGQFRPFGFRLSEALQAKLRYLQNGSTYDPATGTISRDDDAPNIKGNFYVFGAIQYTDGRGGKGDRPTYISVFRRIWDRSLGAFERTGPWDEYAD